jgi:hypothetical protein
MSGEGKGKRGEKKGGEGEGKRMRGKIGVI